MAYWPLPQMTSHVTAGYPKNLFPSVILSRRTVFGSTDIIYMIKENGEEWFLENRPVESPISIHIVVIDGGSCPSL